MNNVKRNLAACLILCLALSLAGCAGESGSDSKVYQGTCLTMANDAKTLTLSNTEPKLNPIKGEKATFDLCKAKVGLLPEKGDVIRGGLL